MTNLVKRTGNQIYLYCRKALGAIAGSLSLRPDAISILIGNDQMFGRNIVTANCKYPCFTAEPNGWAFGVSRTAAATIAEFAERMLMS